MKEENEEIIGEILKERIEENKKLFSKGELKIINDNINIIKKVYLLATLDSKF